METQVIGYNVMKNKESHVHLIGKKILILRLEDYVTIKPLIDKLELNQNVRVLNLGCGNAEFSEDMYDDGFENIVNVDIAENVIDFMAKRNENRKKMICNNVFYFS